MLATRFFTSVIEKRKPIFDLDGLDFIQTVESILYHEVNAKLIQLHTYCIMPNHVHILFSEPFNQSEFSTRFLRITARKILEQNKRRAVNKRIDFQVNKSDRQEQVWRRNSKSILISNKRSYFAAFQYISSNTESEYWKDCIPETAKQPNIPCQLRIWSK